MAYQAPLGPRGLPIAYAVRELRIEPAGSADHQNPLLLQLEIHFWASEIKTR